MTWRPLKRPSRHSSCNADATAPASFTSPFSKAPAGRRTCATRASAGGLPRSSAARTAVAPMSTPMRERDATNRAISARPLGVDGAVGQVLVHVGFPDPIVLADAHCGQLAGLNEPVDGHVRHP